MGCVVAVVVVRGWWVVGGRWWVVGWLVFRTRDRVFPHSVWIVLSECIGVLSSVAKPLCRYRGRLCRLSATVDSGFFFVFGEDWSSFGRAALDQLLEVRPQL